MADTFMSKKSLLDVLTTLSETNYPHAATIIAPYLEKANMLPDSFDDFSQYLDQYVGECPEIVSIMEARVHPMLDDSSSEETGEGYGRRSVKGSEEDVPDEDPDDDEDLDDDDEIDDDDEDDDEEDDDEDDDDEDDDDEDDDTDDASAVRADKKVPLGKRVILRTDYRTDNAYCNAVLKSMSALLRKEGIVANPRQIRDGVYVFAFDKSMNGVDMDAHVLCEYNICNYRLEFVVNAKNEVGRVAVLDHFCQECTFPLRYGKVIMDHDDGEKKIELSACFYGAFSEETFMRYWTALVYTAREYAKKFADLASGKLGVDDRKRARSILNDVAACMPSRPQADKQALFDKVLNALDGTPSLRYRKLLAYVVDRME